MRLIDADALMEQFPCTTRCKKCDLSKDGFLPCDIKDKIKEAPTVEVPNEKWIPCSERLPKTGQVVIVTDDRGKVYEYLNPDTTSKWRFLEHEILAWMPLPEPYKGEGDEK